MKDIGLFPPIPVFPECLHPSRGGSQAPPASRIQPEKMQAGGTFHTSQKLAVCG